MGFKPMFLFKGGERKGNAQVFATESEARESALARFMVGQCQKVLTLRRRTIQ
jgi:hypothetical protein